MTEPVAVELASAISANVLGNVSLALKGVPLPGPWAQRGACREIGNTLFFSQGPAGVRAAKEICARCVVRSDCADYALAAPGLRGVFGGLSELDRRRIRNNQRADGPVAEEAKSA